MKSKEQSRVWDEYAARLPGDPTVQEDYARALIELSAPAEKILSAAETAAKLSPGAGGPQACRAQALFALRRWAEALEAVNVAIQLNPDDTAPRVLRLRILEKLQAKSG